jgi:glycosyltransferase involved in cell wall biosynthesis
VELVSEPTSPTPRTPPTPAALRAVRRVGRAGWRALRWTGRLSPRLRLFGARLRPAISELLNPKVEETPDIEAARMRDSYPAWLRADWRDAHRFEPGLFPARDLLKTMRRWTPEPTRFTGIYWDLVKAMSFDGQSPEYVFLVPWLVPGGATTVLVNYLLAIREADPNAKVAVLVTTPRPTGVSLDPRLEGVRFIDVPLSFAGLDPSLQERLISTLLVQFGPRVVHLINAHVGYRSYARHYRQLTVRSRLFVSLFTIDEDAEGRMIHPVLDNLPDYVDALSGIFVDNEPLRDRLVTLYAIPESRFVVHFQPTEMVEKAQRRGGRGRPGRLSVLWAARLDQQKRPDILVAVAERVRALNLPIDFYASGMTVLDERPQLVEDLAAAGVELLGPYDDSITSLGRTFDVLLNTSQWEGLPLVLIDAALHDLTIVAAPVGGVVDFVEDQKTGFLVDRFDDLEGYVTLLSRLARDPKLVASTRSAAKRLAQSRHTWDVFAAKLRAVVGYLP